MCGMVRSLLSSSWHCRHGPVHPSHCGSTATGWGLGDGTALTSADPFSLADFSLPGQSGRR